MAHASIRTLFVVALAAGCSRSVDSTEVARSLVRNAAGLVLAADADRSCGFDSPAAEISVEGAPGAMGRATFTVRDCVLAFELERGCGVRTLGGRATVSGVRTIVGTVTGNPKAPIVADGPSATTITLQADLDGFHGDGDHDAVSVLGVDGRVALDAVLVRAASVGGGCTVATPNVALTSFAFSEGRARVVDGSTERTVEIAGTALSAVQGVVDTRENVLTGDVVVDGAGTALDDSLDVDYSTAGFLESYACRPDLALPVSLSCGAPSPAAASRLAARSAETLAFVAELARHDTRCGFAAATPIVEAASGYSYVTRQIERCRIEIDDVQISSCGRNATNVSGAVTVSGFMRVDGRNQRAVPNSDDALSYELTEVVFEGFGVERRGERVVVTGLAAGNVQPRLARASDTGSCTVASGVVRLDDVTLNGVIALVDAPGEVHAQGTIEHATIDAVVGRWDAENTIAGTVTIAGETVELSGRFDPSYDRVAFDARWQCGAIAKTNPFVCDSATSLGVDVARAGVAVMTTFGTLIEADTACGFSAGGSATVTGVVGSDAGRGTFGVTACVLDYPSATVVDTDCYGVATYVQGRAVVSGTKTIDGWVTGDPARPLLPTTRTGVRYDLSIEADGLRVWRDGEDAATFVRGTLAGAYVPRVAVDEDTGACTHFTPEARVSGLSIEDAIVETPQHGAVAVAGASLSATLESEDANADDENRVSGQLTLDATSVTIPATDLDPNYDALRFVASFACREGMFIPFDDLDCDMRQVLGEVGARLLVQSIGSVTEVVNRDDFDCAFGGDDVYDEPSQVVGQLGAPGYIQWQIPNCRMRFANNRQGTPYDTDCTDHDKYFDGAATVDAARVVRGLRDEIDVTFGSDVQYVHPLDPNATRIDYRSVAFEDFSAYVLAPDVTAPEQKLVIHSGSLAGTVEPFTGPDDGSDEYFEEGDYDIATPVARISDLAASGIDATITYEGWQFSVRIDDAAIDAFNGSWVGAVGETNRISGTMVVDGRSIELARRGQLDPDYDQSSFDASYVCTERLLMTLPPER